MVGAVGMAVGMTVETGNAQAGSGRPPVFGRVKLLLRELGQQEAQPFELFWVQQAVKNLVVIIYGDQSSLGHITEVRPGGKIYSRGWVWKKILRQVKIQVKANQPWQEVGDHRREEHAPLGMVGKRERLVWEKSLRFDLFRSQLVELLPRYALKSGRRPHRNGFTA